jgi:hypothetical protein
LLLGERLLSLLTARAGRERRQVRALQPVLPVELRDVERELLTVLGREGVEELLRAGGREGRSHRGVWSVDAAVVEAHPGAFLGARDPAAQVRGHVPLRQAGDDLARDAEAHDLRFQPALHRTAAGEAPLGGGDRASPGVAQGVLEEVLPDVFVEVPVAQGVAVPGGDLENLGVFGPPDGGR